MSQLAPRHDSRTPAKSTVLKIGGGAILVVAVGIGLYVLFVGALMFIAVALVLLVVGAMLLRKARAHFGHHPRT